MRFITLTLAAGLVLGFADAAAAQTTDVEFEHNMTQCRAVGEALRVQLSDLHDVMTAPGSGSTPDAIKAVTDMQSSIENDYMSVFGDSTAPDTATVAYMKTKSMDDLLDMTGPCFDMLNTKLQKTLDESDKAMSDADAAIAKADALIAKSEASSSSAAH